MQARVMRVLAYPVLTPALACGLMLLFVTTGWMGRCAHDPVVAQLTGALFLVVGLLFAVPMVGESDDMLPAWCTPGLRVFIAFIDGLADSIPSLLVMLASTLRWQPWGGGSVADQQHDQMVSGALMFCVAELVGLPVILGAAVQWIRDDSRRARQIDAELDAAAAQRRLVASRVISPWGEPEQDSRLEQPWWETER